MSRKCSGKSHNEMLVPHIRGGLRGGCGLEQEVAALPLCLLHPSPQGKIPQATEQVVRESWHPLGIGGITVAGDRERTQMRGRTWAEIIAPGVSCNWG